MTPAARWAVRAYPPSFRERYGGELEALTDDLGPSRRATADLYRGALGAWLRPRFSGVDAARGRLQASVVTVWVAWCAGFMLAPAINKALLDPPVRGADASVRWLVEASTALVAVGWIVALIGAAAIVWRSLLPALRAGRLSVLRPLVPALVLGAVEVTGLVFFAVTAFLGQVHPSRAVYIVGAAWLVGLLALLVAMGLGPAAAVRRLRPSEQALRVPTWLAAALTVCLSLLTATSAAAVLVGVDARLFSTFAPVVVVVLVAVAASATAVVSSTRGVRALRATTPGRGAAAHG